MPLVPLRPVLDATVKYGYAQGAFNVNAVAQAEAVIAVHEMFRSPAILQGADLANAFMGGRVDFANGTLEDKKKGARNIAEAVKKFAEQSPSEIYYGLSGHGMMLMETPEGQVDWKEIGPGEALYVPGRWAHRSINTGTEPLVMFFVYRGDAGHDYGTIEEKGYRKLVVERDGRPAVIDNPKWKV